MNRRTTEEQAKKTYERALKMEHEFGEYFTGKSEFNFLSLQFDSLLIFSQVLCKKTQSKTSTTKWSSSSGRNQGQLFGFHRKNLYDNQKPTGLYHYRRESKLGRFHAIIDKSFETFLFLFFEAYVAQVFERESNSVYSESSLFDTIPVFFHLKEKLFRLFTSNQIIRKVTVDVFMIQVEDKNQILKKSRC